MLYSIMPDAIFYFASFNTFPLNRQIRELAELELEIDIGITVNILGAISELYKIIYTTQCLGSVNIIAFKWSVPKETMLNVMHSPLHVKLHISIFKWWIHWLFSLKLVTAYMCLTLWMYPKMYCVYTAVEFHANILLMEKLAPSFVCGNKFLVTSSAGASQHL